MARNMVVVIMVDCTKSMQDLQSCRPDGFIRPKELFLSYVGMVRDLLVKNQKVRVRPEYIGYHSEILGMEQEKQYPYFVSGGTGSGKSTFLAALRQETLNQWSENRRNPMAMNSWDVNHRLQQIRKLQKNAMQNKLVKFLMGKVRAERKDCFDEMYNDERKMMWEQLYTELEQRQKSLLKDALEMLCGYSGEGTDISKTSEQIREAIKSIMETYNRQGSKRNSLRKSRKIRKKENREEMQIRLLKRLFDPRKETHGDVGICRNDTISHKGMICRKADVRKECIHDIPNNLTLIQHQTRPSVFLPNLQTLGGNKWIPIMSAA